MAVKPKKTKIIFVPNETDACSYYRIILPCRALEAKGYNAHVAASNKDFDEADILVFQRLHGRKALHGILTLKQQGKKIVVDYDDNFFLLEDHNPAKALYSAEALEKMQLVMSEADAVSVTVKTLADSYGKFNKNIFILPNCVDKTALNFDKRQAPKLTIGWQGSDTHKEDLRRIKSVINDLWRKFDFEFVLAGYNPAGFFRYSVFREGQTFSYDLSHQSLFNDFDIGICPLQPSPFNECKSDLKFIEYATLGIPTIASNVLPYETIDHGHTGYLARNLSDWERYLSELIHDEDRRREIGTNARNYVAGERTIQKNIHLWEDVLNNLF